MDYLGILISRPWRSGDRIADVCTDFDRRLYASNSRSTFGVAGAGYRAAAAGVVVQARLHAGPQRARVRDLLVTVEADAGPRHRRRPGRGCALLRLQLRGGHALQPSKRPGAVSVASTASAFGKHRPMHRPPSTATGCFARSIMNHSSAMATCRRSGSMPERIGRPTTFLAPARRQAGRLSPTARCRASPVASSRHRPRAGRLAQAAGRPHAGPPGG
jgi:hypothetical protein